MEKITTSLLYHYTYSETLTTTTTLSLTLTLTQLRPFSFFLSLSLSLTDPPFSVLFISSSSLSPSFSLYPSSFGFFSPRALQFFSRRPKFSFINEYFWICSSLLLL